MRKLILIAALSLLATQACAGGSRSLSLAATNAHEQAAEPATPQTATAQQTTPATNIQTPATTPTVTATTTTPVATPPAPQAAPTAVTTTEPAKTTVANKPKRRVSDEARLIRELHRHGIYW